MLIEAKLQLTELNYVKHTSRAFLGLFWWALIVKNTKYLRKQRGLGGSMSFLGKMLHDANSFARYRGAMEFQQSGLAMTQTMVHVIRN